MRQIIFVLAMCVALGACKKSKNNYASLNGTYKGTFHRAGPGNQATAQVTLTFTNGKFTGQSSIDNYPGICNGSFSINDDKVANFNNACVWTANFDWTFILKGEYITSISGDTLRMERAYPGVILFIDKYELIKQL